METFAPPRILVFFFGEASVLIRSRRGAILRLKDAAILRDWLTQWIEEQEKKEVE